MDPIRRAGLKGRGPGAIFTGGPLWRNSWRHRLEKLCFRWFARFPFVFLAVENVLTQIHTQWAARRKFM